MTLLTFSDVSFAYPGVPVLEHVSLAVEAGERVALVGPNGVGKTTLTKLAVALLHPDEGSVEVAGRSTDGLAPEDLADVAAYLFQHADQQLFARTLLDEVAFGPRTRGAASSAAEQGARVALQRVGLGPFAARHPYDLSPAERKLLTLATAIAQRPELLVLDEPTQGMDRARAGLVAEVLGEVADDGTALLCVTHDLGFVTEVFHRVVVLAGGLVAHDGPAAELVRDEELVRQLGLVPSPPAVLARRLGLAGHPVRVRDVADALTARCRK